MSMHSHLRHFSDSRSTICHGKRAVKEPRRAGKEVVLGRPVDPGVRAVSPLVSDGYEALLSVTDGTKEGRRP